MTHHYIGDGIVGWKDNVVVDIVGNEGGDGVRLLGGGVEGEKAEECRA